MSSPTDQALGDLIVTLLSLGVIGFTLVVTLPIFFTELVEWLARRKRQQ